MDLEGRVVGVNSAIKSQTGFYSGYGFAIPANLANSIKNQLLAGGVVRRGTLGIDSQDVDARLAKDYGVAIEALSGLMNRACDWRTPKSSANGLSSAQNEPE